MLSGAAIFLDLLEKREHLTLKGKALSFYHAHVLRALSAGKLTGLNNLPWRRQADRGKSNL